MWVITSDVNYWGKGIYSHHMKNDGNADGVPLQYTIFRLKKNWSVCDRVSMGETRDTD